MEKISRIVPANARTKAVDVSRSQPVRPGAPTWGRPEGKVTKGIEDKVSFSSIAAERPLEPNYTRGLTDARKTKIAREMTEKFFMERTPQKELTESEGPLSEQMADSISESDLSNVNPLSSNDDSE